MVAPNRFFEEDTNKMGEVRYIFKFGKHKGDFLEDVITEFTGRKYVEWMVEEMENMPEDVKDMIEEQFESYEREHGHR